MTVGVAGLFEVLVYFGDNLVRIDPSMIKNFIIVQDMQKFVPQIHLALEDNSGIAIHILPFDKKMSNIRVEVKHTLLGVEKTNKFNFKVFRKKPISEFASSGVYDIVGQMAVPGLYAPTKTRVRNQTVKSFLEEVAEDDLGITRTSIGAGLNTPKKIIQPNWTAATMLRYLQTHLIGSDGLSAYQAFIRVTNSQPSFIFRSIESFCSEPPIRSYVVSDLPIDDMLPVFDHQVFDNYMALGASGSKAQTYQYFDYTNSVMVNASESLDDFYSLTDYHLVDRDDTEYSAQFTYGTTNEFTSDFQGQCRAMYHSRLINLSQMWITTYGDISITPGRIVDMLFAQEIQSGSKVKYQYSGYWMVQKVVHSFSNTFLTRLLLTRNGVDTSSDTTLVSAVRKKKKEIGVTG